MSIKLKIIFIGSSGVGKTSIIKRIRENIFVELYRPTRDAGFIHYKIEDYKNRNWNFLIWDMGSQLKFDKDLQRYCEGANVIVYVYDVTNPYSINEGHQWFEKFFAQSKQGVPILFVGNKIDLPIHTVTEQDVDELKLKIENLLGKHIPSIHLLVSAKKNIGMNEILHAIILLAQDQS